MTTPATASAKGPLGADLRAKERALRENLVGSGRVIVALSGGVDSSYLAYLAHNVLGDDSLAITAVSPSYPQSHRALVETLVAAYGLRHRFVETREMDSAAYRANDSDRCYHCKSELFRVLDDVAAESGFDTLAYGVNTDDLSDYRPGHRAAAEYRVAAPFTEVEISKAEIRALAREAGLPCADEPASACLSSRLPYGTEVTAERLAQVEAAEAALRGLGFRQLRVRHHGELARIEIDPAEMSRALDATMARSMSAALREVGFRWVSLDLDGYRTGSLNEVLFVSTADAPGGRRS